MSNNKAMLVITSAVCICSVTVMIFALSVSNKKIGDTEANEKGTAAQTEVFVPPEFDKNVEKGIPDVPENLGYSDVDAKEFIFSVCGKIICENNSADIYLTNPKESDVWLKIRILDKDDLIIAETGLVKPGEYLKSISISNPLSDGSEIKLKVMAYEPDTYYSGGAVTLKTTITLK